MDTDNIKPDTQTTETTPEPIPVTPTEKPTENPAAEKPEEKPVEKSVVKPEEKPEEKPADIARQRRQAAVEQNIDLLGADRAITPSQLSNVLMSVLMAIIGLVFIGWCDQPRLHQAIMVIAALAFIIPGLALLMSLIGKKDRRAGVGVGNGVCGAVALILGIVILVAPDVFKPFLVYLFGGVLILIAIWQFYLMLRRNRVVDYPAWLKLLPVLVAATGIVMCVLDIFRYNESSGSLKWTMLAAGFGFTVIGLTGLIISYYAARNNHTVKRILAARAARARQQKQQQ